MDETRPAASILIVDDDPEVLELLTETLHEQGYAVLAAATPEQALSLMRGSLSPRMLITDVRMVGMSGIELADRAQGVLPDLKVILMSGYFLPRFIDRRFLKKPFRTEDLIAAVAEELRDASEGLQTHP